MKYPLKDVIFDVEVLPNWWCVSHTHPDDMSKIITITSDDEKAVEKVDELRYSNLLIGFYIKGYDMRIMQAIVDGLEPQSIYDVSRSIIEDKVNKYNDYFIYWSNFNFSDLYDDWRFGSLKQFESNVGLDIKESEIDFHTIDLSDADKKELIEYCEYDVYATVKLYKYRKDYLDSKRILSDEFKIPYDVAMKSTNAKLVALILEAKKSNLSKPAFYTIPKQVEDYIRTYVPQKGLDCFTHIMYEPQDKPKKDPDLILFENEIFFGVGGIHSTYKKNIAVKETDTMMLLDIDVKSYYPNLIIHFDYMSRAVSDRKKFPSIYTTRAKLKSEKNPREKSYKLLLNTAYGATKDKYNKLYDPYNASSLCYTGQLLLAALANQLYLQIPNLKVIQTNTDGILTYAPKDQLDNIRKIISDWEKLTNLEMEENNLKLFFQRDVNNYIGVDTDDKIKLKGKWANQADEYRLLSNLNAPVVHRAILDYYMHNKPIEETINECDNPLDFCFTTKMGRSYITTYQYVNGKLVELNNKVNRVYATTNKDLGTLVKYKVEDEKERYDKVAEIPEHCNFLNIMGNGKLPVDLDKEWYLYFADKKLEELEWLV